MRKKEDIERLMKEGKHFCILPWVHLHVTYVGDMAPCCAAHEKKFRASKYGSLNENSFKELWQGEIIRKFRLKLLNDEPSEICIRCYESDNAGLLSMRMEVNETYADRIDWVLNTDESGYAPDAKPVYWNFRFSNTCNFKCRTCRRASSSAWEDDTKVLGFYNPENELDILRDPDKLFKDLDEYYPDVEKIDFSGGEPLLQREMYTVIRKLDAIKKYDIQLLYNTNFSQIYTNDNNITELWKKFNNLIICVSLDGSGKRGEYIRKGLVWDDTIKKMERLKSDCPKADLRINFTFSAFNIMHLPDFHKEIIKRKIVKPNRIDLNLLLSPEYYNIKILPPKMKKQAAKKMRRHLSWLRFYYLCSACGIRRLKDIKKQIKKIKTCTKICRQWKACIKYMNSEDWSHLIPKFIKVTNKLDEVRNEKCMDVFPELKPLFEFSKKS